MPWIRTDVLRSLRRIGSDPGRSDGVGPRTIRLLPTYWDHLTMVARTGGYFGLMFKGYRGVTQGNPLPPMIFNVVRDTIIHHWVTVAAPTANILEGLDPSIGELAAYLYADNGLVTSRGYIGPSTSSLASLTKSASGKTQGIRSECHASHAMLLDGCPCNRTRGRRRG